MLAPTADRAVERYLERLVGRLVAAKRQIVAEHDEAVGQVGGGGRDVRQVDQVVLVDLDQAQAGGGVARQQRLDQRGFSRAAAAPQQRVVGRCTGQELARVAIQRRLGAVDALQVVQIQALRVPDRHKRASLARQKLPARRQRRLPVDGRRGRWQQVFQPAEQGFGAVDESGEVGVHDAAHSTDSLPRRSAQGRQGLRGASAMSLGKRRRPWLAVGHASLRCG
nr:G335 [uncultured bacterium]